VGLGYLLCWGCSLHFRAPRAAMEVGCCTGPLSASFLPLQKMTTKNGEDY
jgi:hypothetical protein